MTTALNRSYALKRLITILAVIIVTGCTPAFQDSLERANKKPASSVAYEEALTLYAQGKYEKAMERFKKVAVTDGSNEMRLKAKLGETCCRLMTAGSPADYYRALRMWNDFGRLAAEGNISLDFSMIDPVIVHITTKNAKQEMKIRQTDIRESNLRKSEKADKPAKEPIHKSEQDQKQNKEVKAEIETLNKKAKKADQLQRQVDEIKAENRSLTEKIKAFEAIDQNIQKKKTEIASPGE